MARPRKSRRVWHEPTPVIFKPVGLPLRQLPTITLLHEELEALHLTDLEERYQSDAAEQMGVSRSTFQRVVSAARHKVAQALVEGAALHIQGGTFRVPTLRWQCDTCGHRWEMEHGSGHGAPAYCPSCGSHVLHLKHLPRKARAKHSAPPGDASK